MGELHVHDGLMALACRERQIRLLASSDRDCDRLSWLTRVATPAEVVGATPSIPESDLPASPAGSYWIPGAWIAPERTTRFLQPTISLKSLFFKGLMEICAFQTPR
jgi:hypothetical protein